MSDEEMLERLEDYEPEIEYTDEEVDAEIANSSTRLPAFEEG